MNFAQQMLDKVGLSQMELAMYLRITTSQLSHFLADKRTLPTAALLRVIPLCNLSAELPEPPMPLPNETEKAAWQKEADWYKFECQALQKKLDKIILKYRQACNMLQLLDKLGPATPTDPAYVQGWIDGNRDMAGIRKEENGWLAQKTVQIQIDLLQQKAAMWEAAIK